LLSINGTTVRNQTHAEELLRNAKNMSPDDKNLISLKFLQNADENYAIKDLNFTSINNPKVKNEPDLVQNLHQICDKEFLSGNYNSALGTALSALSLSQSTGLSISFKQTYIAQSYEKIAICMKKLGNIVDAITNYNSALEILVNLHGKKNFKVLKILENLGNLYCKSKQYDSSFEIFKELLDIIEFFDMKHFDQRAVGNIYHSFAILYREVGENEKSEQKALQSLEIRTLYLGENHPDIARSLNFIASLKMQKGDIRLDVENMFLKAFDILNNSLPVSFLEMLNLAMLSRNIAWYYCNRRDYSKAELYKRREVELRYSLLHLGCGKNLDFPGALWGLAKILRKNGKHTESDQVKEKAVNAYSSSKTCSQQRIKANVSCIL
jgi:tetratricopeptide (TPR) repeat protein